MAERTDPHTDIRITAMVRLSGGKMIAEKLTCICSNGVPMQQMMAGMNDLSQSLAQTISIYGVPAMPFDIRFQADKRVHPPEKDKVPISTPIARLRLLIKVGVIDDGLLQGLCATFGRQIWQEITAHAG